MAKQNKIVQWTHKYLIPNYGRLPISMAKGQGARVWDADGRQYIDFFAGFGAGGIGGHCHPAIVSAVRSQARKLLSCGNLFTNEPQVQLAKRIVGNAFGGKVFYCHSGAEANEAALKLVRLAANIGAKPGAAPKYKIVSFHNCFHGRTMGALSLTPEKYQKGFEPMLPGNVKVPYGDLDAVRSAVDSETAGIFVEPIQGEGGINIPTREFMRGLRALCDERGMLLVSDEVWTSPARTGKWFAYQHYDIQPDIMTLGKAIGGGLPLAVMIAAPKWADVLQPGSHGCTMGGNPLCAAAGVATMKLIEKEELIKRAANEGPAMMQSIRDAGAPCVKDVRGRGFMLGIELDRPGKDIFSKCLERGLLINCTQEKVLRIAPPLVATDSDLSEGLDILIDVLKS